jgi:hypothetical protein
MAPKLLVPPEEFEDWVGLDSEAATALVPSLPPEANGVPRWSPGWLGEVAEETLAVRPVSVTREVAKRPLCTVFRWRAIAWLINVWLGQGGVKRLELAT